MTSKLRCWTGAFGIALMATCSANAQQKVPEGYPANYSEMVTKALSEGKVTIYSNMRADVWTPILAGFKKAYPTINVETLDFDDEMFERYLAEKTAGAPTADLLVTPSIAKWLEFAKRNEVADYVSPEAAGLPEWARPLPGVSIISVDSYILAYNKALIPPNRYPKTMKDVAALVKDFPNLKVTTYDPLRATNGHAAWSSWIRDHGDAGWALLDSIGPAIRGETAVVTMVDKLMVGDYGIAYFTALSGVVRTLQKPGADKILGYNLIQDGTPMVPRGMAITKGATHPNAARVFADFMLSRTGQLALAEALTPVRSDISRKDVKSGVSYSGIVEDIGEKGVVHVNFDKKMYDEYDQFTERWRRMLRGGK